MMSHSAFRTPAAHALRVFAAGLLAAGLSVSAHAANAAAAPGDAALASAASHYLEQLARDQGLMGDLTVKLVHAPDLADCPAPQVMRASTAPLGTYETLTVTCPRAVRYAQVTVALRGAYAVTARSVDMGSTLAADDLRLQRGNLLGLPLDARQDPGAWAGMIATRRLAAGTLLRTNAVRSARSVARDQTVRLLYEIPGLRVTNSGTALSAGDVGDVVRVKTANGRVLSGRIAADGAIHVHP